MRKNILIIVLLIASSLSVVIAYVKSNEAEKRRLEAKVNLEMAVKNHEHTKKQEELALQVAAEATLARAKVEESMAMYLDSERSNSPFQVIFTFHF